MEIRKVVFDRRNLLSPIWATLVWLKPLAANFLRAVCNQGFALAHGGKSARYFEHSGTDWGEQADGKFALFAVSVNEGADSSLDLVTGGAEAASDAPAKGRKREEVRIVFHSMLATIFIGEFIMQLAGADIGLLHCFIAACGICQRGFTVGRRIHEIKSCDCRKVTELLVIVMLVIDVACIACFWISIVAFAIGRRADQLRCDLAVEVFEGMALLICGAAAGAKVFRRYI